MADSSPSVFSAASVFSAELMVRFVELGVRHVVLSPGSRSQALALVAAELEARGDINLHVRVDERVAGFVALGIGVESTVPALVITTSGSAVANLHPAVLEAHHSGVPMIVLTADRPEELQGIGSNQTTVQADFFSDAVRLSLTHPAPTADDVMNLGAVAAIAEQAYAAAVQSDSPGPVHLNLSFREPLSAIVPVRTVADHSGNSANDHTTDHSGDSASDHTADHTGDNTVRDVVRHIAPKTEASVTLERGTRSVVIAGANAGERAEQVAREGGWPLIAEVTSGARFGPNLIPAYREVLHDPSLVAELEQIIVFGHPTLSREVPQLISQAATAINVIVVVGAAAEPYNPGHRVNSFVRDVDVTQADSSDDWCARWVNLGRQIISERESLSPGVDVALAHSSDISDKRDFARQELAVTREPVTRESLVSALWRLTWPHDRLAFAASRLIRVADRVVGGKKIKVHANRGLSGIDGNISTGIGIALAAPAALTRIVVGDLAAVHDAGALAFGKDEAKPRVQLIIGNDGGGTIFDALEVSTTAPRALADRVLLTPQQVDFEALAHAYGWDYQLVTNVGELERALTTTVPGDNSLLLTEVRLSRADS